MNSFLNNTIRNILWFKKAHDSNEIDMTPSFQRNPVWVDKQKSYLIDTILNGYPIPEIYMQEVINENGRIKNIIVDGQQRIRAILEFIEGGFTLDSKDSPEWADMKFDELTGDEKRKFYEYNFVVRILPSLPETEIRNIFQRLNRNTVVLNKQELRKSTYWGTFIKTMEKISNEEIWGDFDVFTPNDIRRMIDVEFISELTIAMLHGLQEKKNKLDHWYQAYEIEFIHKRIVERNFDKILNEIQHIFKEIKKTRFRQKADFYTLFLLFSERLDKFPISKTKRNKLEKFLVQFGEQVNQHVNSDISIKSKLNKNIKLYISGVRGSTDLGSRKRRAEGLGNEIDKIL